MASANQTQNAIKHKIPNQQKKNNFHLILHKMIYQDLGVRGKRAEWCARRHQSFSGGLWLFFVVVVVCMQATAVAAAVGGDSQNRHSDNFFGVWYSICQQAIQTHTKTRAHVQCGQTTYINNRMKYVFMRVLLWRAGGSCNPLTPILYTLMLTVGWWFAPAAFGSVSFASHYLLQ